MFNFDRFKVLFWIACIVSLALFALGVYVVGHYVIKYW